MSDRERGLYEGLGLTDSARTRRPQSRALRDAALPVSHAEFAKLVARVEALESAAAVPVVGLKPAQEGK